MMRPSHTARSESGQTLPIIAVFLLILLVMLGLAIDIGNAYRVQDALQASADAAATAGAGTLTMSYPASTANAISAAKTYTSSTSGRNPITGVPASNVTQTVTTSCVQSATEVPCTTANTVTVTESAQVPTFFLGLIGYKTIAISATAKACSPCNELPLDIELVIDRTGSMSSNSKMTNLRAGLINGFLPGLDATSDQVGLTVLPPDMNGTSDVCSAQPERDYPNNPPDDMTPLTGYDLTNPTYNVVPLTDDYQTGPGTLDTTSTLVKDINCLKPGGLTDYSNALEAGYDALQTQGRTGVQKVIVLLSDGAANEGQNCTDVVKTTTTGSGKNKKTTTTYSPDTDVHCTQPCQTAVNDAATYKAQGVLVYTILYGDQSDAPYCLTYQQNNESPRITPDTAMSEMAGTNKVTGASDYYPDPDPTDLTGIFQQISADMAAGTSRIIG